METAYFWIAWGIISFWALRIFYYSFSKEKLERLRKASLGINLAVFVLMLLPWLPSSHGGKNGLAFVLEGNPFAIMFALLLLISLIMFISKNTLLLKLASITTIINTFFLFALMFQLRPGTFIQTWYDVAPIIAVLLLLVGDVIVFLLWQQLQLKTRK